jgi:hypothetical protein
MMKKDLLNGARQQSAPTFDSSDVVQESNGVEAMQCSLAIVLILGYGILVNQSCRIPERSQSQRTRVVELRSEHTLVHNPSLSSSKSVHVEGSPHVDKEQPPAKPTNRS